MSMDSSLIPNAWQVPQQFRYRVGTRPGRQRIMEAEGHLLLVLHGPPEADEDMREGRIFWRDANGNWMPKGLRHTQHSIGELLHEYDQAINRVDDREEAATTADEYFEILRDLNPLVRSANNLHDTMQKARQAAPDDRELVVLRDAAYAMARRAELLYTDTRHALDYHIALRAEQQAENGEAMAVASYRLNLLVAFFFPIATMAGIFGMNVPTGLEALSHQTGMMTLFSILACGLMMGFLLTLFVTRPAKKHKREKRRKKKQAQQAQATAAMAGKKSSAAVRR